MMIDEDQDDEKRRRSAWVASIEAKQRNTIWPDTLRNGQQSDAFLWNGLSNPSKIQRVGAAIFGLFFVMAAVSFLSMAWNKRSVFLGLFSLFWLLVGARVTRNSFPRPGSDKHGPDDLP